MWNTSGCLCRWDHCLALSTGRQGRQPDPSDRSVELVRSPWSLDPLRRATRFGMNRTVALLFTVVLAAGSGCQMAATGYNVEGVRLNQQGDLQGALAKFQKALENDPKNADAFYNLAATTHRIAKANNDPNLMTQAEGMYHQCLDRDANHVDCHRAAGNPADRYGSQGQGHSVARKLGPRRAAIARSPHRTGAVVRGVWRQGEGRSRVGPGHRAGPDEPPERPGVGGTGAVAGRGRRSGAGPGQLSASLPGKPFSAGRGSSDCGAATKHRRRSSPFGGRPRRHPTAPHGPLLSVTGRPTPDPDLPPGPSPPNSQSLESSLLSAGLGVGDQRDGCGHGRFWNERRFAWTAALPPDESDFRGSANADFQGVRVL